MPHTGLNWKFKMGWDKVWHCLGCCLLALIAIPLGVKLTGEWWPGAVLVMVGGFLKEVKDYKDPNHIADVWDFVADVLGVSIAVAIFWCGIIMLVAQIT